MPPSSHYWSSPYRDVAPSSSPASPVFPLFLPMPQLANRQMTMLSCAPFHRTPPLGSSWFSASGAPKCPFRKPRHFRSQSARTPDSAPSKTARLHSTHANYNYLTYKKTSFRGKKKNNETRQVAKQKLSKERKSDDASSPERFFSFVVVVLCMFMVLGE